MPSKLPITNLMSRYCDAAIQLWNESLRPLLYDEFERPKLEEENEWDLRDRYDLTCVELFCALVLWPLGIHDVRPLPAFRGDKVALRFIEVMPVGVTEIRITAENLTPFQGYDNAITRTDQIAMDLWFQDFFDFYVLGIRKFEWVHAVVAACAARPDLNDRAVLLRRSDVEFSYLMP